MKTENQKFAESFGAVQSADGSYTLTANALAPFVAVEADQPGRLSDNAVTLVPGEPATLSFTPDDPGARPQFTLRDLHAATYGA